MLLGLLLASILPQTPRWLVLALIIVVVMLFAGASLVEAFDKRRWQCFWCHTSSARLKWGYKPQPCKCPNCGRLRHERF